MTEQPHLAVEVSVDGKAVHVRLVGDLDIATTDILLDSVRPVVDQHVSEVLIDATALGFMDSTGIGALIKISRMGTPVAITNANDRVRRLLDLVVVDPAVTIRD